MDATASADKAAIASEEPRLARAAAAGDGGAFATLYERYEQRAFNLAYRIVDSEADAADIVKEAFLKVMRSVRRAAGGELAVGRLLLTETRNASHDLMHGRQRQAAGEASSEAEGIRQASARLPERQREALALRELEGLSYEEIAAILGASPHTIAELLSRARINLRDELRGTALASVAPSPQCERALPLIAMRDDDQLEAASPDAIWLDKHLAACSRCPLAAEAMSDAAASYRAWAPIAAVPWLFQETMAKVGDLVGADWSTVIAERSTRAAANSLPGMPSAYLEPGDQARPRSLDRGFPRRGAMLAAGLAALLLLSGLAMAISRDDTATTPAEPAAGAAAANPKASRPSGKSARPSEAKKGAGKKTTEAAAGAVQTDAEDTTSAPVTAAASPANGGSQSDPSAGSRTQPTGETGLEAPRPTATPKPSAKPKPAAAPAPTPTTTPVPAPAPVTSEPPPTEPSEEPPRKREPPGRPADRPPH